jgi:hypothetical protein
MKPFDGWRGGRSPLPTAEGEGLAQYSYRGEVWRAKPSANNPNLALISPEGQASVSAIEPCLTTFNQETHGGPFLVIDCNIDE